MHSNVPTVTKIDLAPDRLLACQSLGSGPTIVLSNGLGGTFAAWRPIVQHLAKRFRVLSFDYRGLYASVGTKRPSDLTLRDHVTDLEVILDHFKIEKALFVGWSMGVQVNFELYRRRPSVFVGLCAINGTAGSPFRTVRGGRAFRKLLPRTLKHLSPVGPIVSRVFQQIAKVDHLIAYAKKFKLVAPSADNELSLEMIQHFSELDFVTYIRILYLLGQHDAWSILPHVKVPVTVIAGQGDLLTPINAAVRMVRDLPDARLVTLPATHYGPIEYPAEVNLALDKLIVRSGLV